MVEVGSRTNNGREVFLDFRTEYLNIVCQKECSYQQPKKFICLLRHLSAVTHLRLIAALSSTSSFG